MLMHDLFCLYISIAVMSLQIDKKYDQCMHQISIPATDENKTLRLQLNPVAEWAHNRARSLNSQIVFIHCLRGEWQCHWAAQRACLNCLVPNNCSATISDTICIAAFQFASHDKRWYLFWYIASAASDWKPNLSSSHRECPNRHSSRGAVNTRCDLSCAGKRTCSYA